MAFTPEEKAAYKKALLKKLGASILEVLPPSEHAPMQRRLRMDDGLIGQDLTNVSKGFLNYLRQSNVACDYETWGRISREDPCPVIGVTLADEAQEPLFREAVQRLQAMASKREPGV